jgi:methylated-DNA-[protein]-cysteine S-methyltransferase
MDGRCYYLSPVGDLLITSRNDKITGIHFLKDHRSDDVHTTPVIDQCISQLEEYFFRGRKFFDVELELNGTAFQNRLWNELLTIPYGKTVSYLEMAIRLGDMNSVRAVGLANGQNPIAIIVPCHRVVGKDGDLVGYAGGLDKKLWLLEHEGAFAEQLKLF